jgi:hypothetical protein
MPFESPIDARVLLSATVGYVKGKYQRMAFMDDAVEHAAMRVADEHERLEPEVFPAAFEKVEVKALIDTFDAGGEPITVERVATTLNEEMIDPELDVDTGQLVSDFFEYLEQEISQNPELGRKIQTVYLQQLNEYATRLGDGQEELLNQIEVIGKDRSETGYEVFQTVDDRFEQQLAGEHPRQRFDLPFYGRTDELEDIVEFGESEANVLIVHGPAGVGKSRLVVEASFKLQASNPEWTVYTANVHADLGTGLSEIDFEEEDGVILFIDDARDADQLERVFDIAERRRPQVKLMFTERSLFATSLEDQANRFSLDATFLPLSPLDSDTVTSIIQDSYGIGDPQTLDWIVNVSEGKPLIAHLLAEQITSGEAAGQDPIAAEDSVLEGVFDDTVRDIQRAAEQQGVDDPQKLESYFRYLAAVGTLDTSKDEFMAAFREVLSSGQEEELRYREILLDAVGTINERSGFLQVQPDALREYVVYDTFFADGLRDYTDTVYDRFGEFTEREQVNNLLVIESRYESREAGAAVDAIVSSHIDHMEEYTVPDRVRLLRRFETLGAASPMRGYELVEAVLTTPLPDDDSESESLRRRIVRAGGDVGNLYFAAISLLSPGLLKEPETITDALVEIALVDGAGPTVREKVFQHLKQTLRPGFARDPLSQTQVVQRLGTYLLEPGLETDFRMDLLDAVGSASSDQAEDFFMDPVERSVGRFRRGPIWRTQAMQNYRLAAVNALIDVIEEGEDYALKVESTGQLNGFVLAQRRYQGAQGEVFNRDELERIYEFAIEYVDGEQDLDCLSKLHQLVENAEDDGLGIQELGDRLMKELLDHDLYQLYLQMAPRGYDWEENEEQILVFIQGLEPNWEHHFEVFSDVVVHSLDTSFNRFFKLFGEEQVEASIQLLEDTPVALEEYRESVVIGVCVGSTERGEELVTEYIERGTYDLACAGQRVLINTDRDFAVSEFECITSELDAYPDDLVVQLASVLRGEWEVDQEWTEDMFLTLLHGARSVTPSILEQLLNALPHRKEELLTVDDAVVADVLDYVVDFERFGQGHRVKLIIEVAAERRPLDYVEFCIDRVHRSHGGVDLLPTHMDVDADRLQESDQYESAVQRLCSIVLDTEEYAPITYSELLQTVPLADVAELLIRRIPNCSEDQLLRVIWYCQIFALSDSIEDLFIALMTEGVTNLREEEAIQRNIISALVSSPMGGFGAVTADRYRRELETVRNWQDDSELPPAVRNFARRAEQAILDDIDHWDRIGEDLL